MYPSRLNRSLSAQRNLYGFSLIEVVLAIGIFSLTALVLVALLPSTISSVDEVERTSEIISVVSTVNAFLQNSENIAEGGGSGFDAIYRAVATEGFATVFVFRRFFEEDSAEVELAVGFGPEDSIGSNAELEAGDFEDAAGSIFRVILTASSVTPVESRSGDRDANGVYRLSQANPLVYTEGYLAMEARIFSEDVQAFAREKPLSDFADLEPIFTYDLAIVR